MKKLQKNHFDVRNFLVSYVTFVSISLISGKISEKQGKE